MNQEAQLSLIRCLDLTLSGEWDAAKELLEGMEGDVAGRLFLLLNELERRNHERSRTLEIARHEIGNALSIALANIEGMIDGIVPATRERQQGIREALASASSLLEELRAALRARSGPLG